MKFLSVILVAACLMLFSSSETSFIDEHMRNVDEPDYINRYVVYYIETEDGYEIVDDPTISTMFIVLYETAEGGTIENPEKEAEKILADMDEIYAQQSTEIGK